MDNVKLIEFQKHGDERGKLVSLEYERECPFVIKRVYYMYDTGKGVRRGYHSHIKLEQVLICVHGSCRIRLDDGGSTQEVKLNCPTKGLYIGDNVWREMYDFSEDAVLLVLASEVYNEEDYVRDYQKFVEVKGKKR